MSRLLIATVVLTLIYALVLASFDPWDLALGAVISVAILLFLRRLAADTQMDSSISLRRLAALVPFTGALLWEILVGSWQVAVYVLASRPPERPGIVVVPFGDRTRLGVAVTGLAVTLSPGTAVLDFDWQQQTIVLHVLDARDPDAVRAHQQRFYDRYQRHVFP
jgi:multisubunit Na+/H+ antiporter MnhE subunit